MTKKTKLKTYIVRWEESMKATVQAKSAADACEQVMSGNVDGESDEMTAGPTATLAAYQDKPRDCGNCSRPHNNGIVAGISRCDRCAEL